MKKSMVLVCAWGSLIISCLNLNSTVWCAIQKARPIRWVFCLMFSTGLSRDFTDLDVFYIKISFMAVTNYLL